VTIRCGRAFSVDDFTPVMFLLLRGTKGLRRRSRKLSFFFVPSSGTGFWEAPAALAKALELLCPPMASVAALHIAIMSFFYYPVAGHPILPHASAT